MAGILLAGTIISIVTGSIGLLWFIAEKIYQRRQDKWRGRFK
jgi:hypothetical protein